MPHPEKSILQQYQEDLADDALFQSRTDFDAQNEWVREQVELLGAEVKLIQTSTERAPADGPGESAGVDPLYGDIIDPEWFEPTEEEKAQKKYDFRVIVEHEPSKQLLKKYGISEERDCIFHFPFEALRDRGLVSQKRFRGVAIGDLVLWDETWYIVLTTHRQAYFGQTTSHYFTTVMCMRYRPNSVPTEDTVPEC